MPRGIPRPDIKIEDVVQRWLFEGETMLAIAVSYDIEVRSINARIQRAREMWPDLPWTERKPNRTIGPTKEWIEMRDGKAGEQGTAGSIIRATRRYRHT